MKIRPGLSCKGLAGPYFAPWGRQMAQKRILAFGGISSWVTQKETQKEANGVRGRKAENEWRRKGAERRVRLDLN